MKPREWWAVLETEEDGDEGYSSGAICSDGGGNLYWQDNQFKVIEKSEYDRLEACCEKLADFARWLAEDSNKYKGTDAQMAASRVLAEYRAMKGEK